MKILFLANLADQFSGLCDAKSIDSQMSCSALGLSYPLNLLKELAQYAEVLIHSPPILQSIECVVDEPILHFERAEIHPGKIRVTIPVTTDVEVLAKDVAPDIIIQFVESTFPFLKNFEKARCLRVLWFVNGPNAAVEDMSVRQFIGSKNADLIIKSVDKSDKLLTSQKLRELGTKVVWLPFSIDGERFRNKYLKRIYDTALIGNLNFNIYLLRLKAFDFLLNHSPSFFYLRAFGEEYVNAINQAKIFFTCTGKHHYPIVKFFEVPACGTLLASDEPIDAENLGFKSGENYVSLEKAWYPNVANPQYPSVESEWTFDQKQFAELLNHYLSSTEERERIAKNGEELIHQYHTDKIRAKEFYEILKRI